jgi:hypothetical protein
MRSSILAPTRRLDAHNFRQSGRIPHNLRESAVRRSSGRAWAGVPATDEAIGSALGIDRSNAARRRSGVSGPYASLLEEVYRLESADISTYALTAHLKSVAMQARLKDTPTEELIARLRTLQTVEQEANGGLDCAQMGWLATDAVCLEALRDRASAQAAVSEEIAAIVDELIARRKP